WFSSAMLFLYAVTFSYAYLTLDTGTGALILFGSVQITMIVLSLLSGNRLHITEWLGVSAAFLGFVYLVMPGVSAPSIVGFVLMTVAGIAWGVYTLRGRGSADPLADTAYNFLRTIPIVAVLVAATLFSARYSVEGMVWAVLSGALASGVGYTIWYTALGGLSATQAAVVQLSVPVIAAFGGVLFVSEAITLRLVVAGVLILGGILLVVLGRYYLGQLRSGAKR
ncbi:MAG: DMT family transporter, partial [Chromatiales bacterium]